VRPNRAATVSVIEKTDPGILIAGVRITGFELACRAAPCCPALGKVYALEFTMQHFFASFFA
jgi:hypothetical protein